MNKKRILIFLVLILIIFVFSYFLTPKRFTSIMRRLGIIPEVVPEEVKPPVVKKPPKEVVPFSELIMPREIKRPVYEKPVEKFPPVYERVLKKLGKQSTIIQLKAS